MVYYIKYMNLYTFTNKNQPHVGKYTVPGMDSMGQYTKTASQRITRQEKLSAENPFRRSKMRWESQEKTAAFDINSFIPAMFVDFSTKCTV